MLFDIIKPTKNSTADDIEWYEMLKRIEKRNKAWVANFDKMLAKEQKIIANLEPEIIY